MITLTEDQWALYLRKYEKLMWMIAHRISGDPITANLEDNFSDLSLAAIESIRGFNKKTGKTFDEMIEMKLFDQYTKTCLWKAKARKGTLLTQKMSFRNKHVSLSNQKGEGSSAYDLEDSHSRRIRVSFECQDDIDSLDTETKEIVRAIENNNCILTKNGSIMIKPLAEELNKSLAYTTKLLKRVKFKYE